MALNADLFRRLERSGYLRVLRALTHMCAAPLWWFVDGPVTGKAIKHNGTICFVDTGAALLAVTAAHVYQQYLSDKRADNRIVCQMGSITFDPENRVIGLNESLDLVTFAVPEILVAAANSRVHRPAHWPTTALKPRDLVMLGGYPGPLRVEGQQQAQFAFVSLATRISQTSDTHLSLQLGLSDALWAPGESLQAGADLGGMSGGPVFRFRDEGVESMELAGFIYQYGNEFEILRARHAFHISSDGTINH